MAELTAVYGTSKQFQRLDIIVSSRSSQEPFSLALNADGFNGDDCDVSLVVGTCGFADLASKEAALSQCCHVVLSTIML